VLATSNQATANQIAGVDTSILLPLRHIPWGRALPFRSLRLYFDGAGEDEGGGLPSTWGFLYGLRINDLLKTGRTDLRIEYADNHDATKPNVFYNHSIYTSGYTYEGRIIGHHMGTDSRDLYVHLSHYVTADLIAGIGYDRQTHNLSGAPQPTTHSDEGSLTWFPSSYWWVQAGYRFEEGRRSGPADNHVFELGLVRRF
jgi:hypothetical protein